MKTKPSASYQLKKGCVQLYTGNGKGKTTAAFGLALRAAGAGLRVLIVQFLKGRVCSEHLLLEKLSPAITVNQCGGAHFIKGKPSSKDIALARGGFNDAQKSILMGRYDVVVFDEGATAVQLGLIDLRDLLTVVDTKPHYVEVVITGRNAPRELIKRADLVTEMREVKHYFNKPHRLGARKGIEM